MVYRKKENTAISRASTISNSDIIDKAGPATSPVKPKKRTIQAIAVLLGILIPAIFIFISEVLNDKITTRFDIEKITLCQLSGRLGTLLLIKHWWQVKQTGAW
ncbi:MAG: hypothetical protein IPH18_09945 [Chitinophagaceae bacterium]|nr:hypothetical protein [Chitinophagaceae bacterium]